MLSKKSFFAERAKIFRKREKSVLSDSRDVKNLDLEAEQTNASFRKIEKPTRLHQL